MRPVNLPRPLALVDGAIGRLIGLGRWLVLPVTLLLFLQWPLRDLVQAFSRDANDLAQWLFALYVSLALTFASREGTHLAADALAQRYRPRTRDRLRRVGNLVAVLPWSLFILVAGAPFVWQSLRQLEGFPDTYNPGYFLVKVAAWLLALLAAAQALLDIFRPRAEG
jgi:TRAP-type mannitol/chloroaromatic compound transport system permease small subunit